jgi:small subunit ribosomal protein S14
MLSSKIKDIKIMNSFKKVEKTKKLKKFLFTALINKTDVSKKASLIISFLKEKKKISNKSRVRMTNRCVLSNRSRGVLRPYGISRTIMRDLMQFGVIPGYSKAVW